MDIGLLLASLHPSQAPAPSHWETRLWSTHLCLFLPLQGIKHCMWSTPLCSCSLVANSSWSCWILVSCWLAFTPHKLQLPLIGKQVNEILTYMSLLSYTTLPYALSPLTHSSGEVFGGEHLCLIYLMHRIKHSKWSTHLCSCSLVASSSWSWWILVSCWLAFTLTSSSSLSMAAPLSWVSCSHLAWRNMNAYGSMFRGVGKFGGDKALEGQVIVCEQWFAPPMLCLLRAFRRPCLCYTVLKFLTCIFTCLNFRNKLTDQYVSSSFATMSWYVIHSYLNYMFMTVLLSEMSIHSEL